MATKTESFKYSPPGFNNYPHRNPSSPVFQGTPVIQKLCPIATQLLQNQSTPEVPNKAQKVTPSSNFGPEQNTQRVTLIKTKPVEETAPQTTIATRVSMAVNNFAFQELSQNPYQFFYALDALSPYFPGLSSHGLQDLTLCACPRLSSSSRVFLEQQTLDLLSRSHQKRSLLTIVSVGPGKCYQELVYLAKLANAGYKRIQLVLIDKEPVPMEALKEARRTYLPPNCNINFKYFPLLESYQSAADTQNHLKPNLLLLLDLTDEECEKQDIQFEEYCFEFFNKNNLIKENTIIASSDAWSNEKDDLFSVVSCGVHDGTTQTLSDAADKREYLTKVDESLPPFLQ